MRTVSIWISISSLGCFLFAGYWGRKIDRSKNLKNILGGTACVLALSPVPYALFSSGQIYWIGPFEYFVNGVAYVGYTVAMTTALLRASPQKRSASYFSVYTAATGLTGAIGNFFGARIADFFAHWDPVGQGFRSLFLIAASLRLSIGCLFFLVLGFEKVKRRKKAHLIHLNVDVE